MAAPFSTDAVKVERFPPRLRHVFPAGHDTGFVKGGVIYASDVQILRLAMGDPIEVMDLDRVQDGPEGPVVQTVTILSIV